ncbi:MAG: GTP-binding protein [Sinobacteraceae bacterium]|nr:GTP-binding protein [Nevskiaceae bacterium]MCP5360212.1 GTP-binding protein [Nevskiaceae bacterium]MCP5466651.1 GTP-binding protein [Nevskiaceae bacterium]
MHSTERIPIIVLTGFLGSGKTVLLNALLQQPGFADSAVIVNEFGEIGLDHLLVASAKENIVLLDAGCLCCAVLGSLKETLADLYHRRARTEVPAFKRVLIETTGLADPAPILQSIMRDSLITHSYRLAGLVCLVDALHGEAQLAAHAEAQAQIAYADRIVVTKTDLLGGTCPESLAQRLRELNPGAEQLVASFGQVAATDLLKAGTAQHDLPWLGSLRPAAARPDSNGRDSHEPDSNGPSPHQSDLLQHAEHPHHDHGAGHDPAIGAVSFLFSGPVTWSGLAAWIEVLRQRHGRDLLRCKGIVNIGGAPVVLHGVQTMFDTRRLAAWPDDEQRSRLVLIGKGLPRRELLASLGWLAAAEGTQPPLDAALAPPHEAGQPSPIVVVGAEHVV